MDANEMNVRFALIGVHPRLKNVDGEIREWMAPGRSIDIRGRIVGRF